MIQYFAFLKAINVGGHNVKMDELRQIFESMSFSKVETFIASGNVIFETGPEDPQSLQLRIEHRLNNALGYEVATFLRTYEQLDQVARYKPFEKALMEQAVAYNVGFMKEPPDQVHEQKVLAMKTEIDSFHIHGTELYWICSTRQSESKIDGKKLEAALSMPVTLRTIKTILRLTEKYLPE